MKLTPLFFFFGGCFFFFSFFCAGKESIPCSFAAVQIKRRAKWRDRNSQDIKVHCKKFTEGTSPFGAHPAGQGTEWSCVSQCINKVYSPCVAGQSKPSPNLTTAS